MRARFSPPDAFPVTFAELAAFAGRNPVLSMLLAGLTVAILVTEAMRLLRGGQRLAPAALTALVNREDALVVDVRAAADFEKGHIPGAKQLALAEVKPEHKLLVAATLVMLVAVDRIAGFSVLAAVVILLREVLVSGLREYLAGLNVGMPVTRLAKWKTGIQMLALGFLIVGDHGPDKLPVTLIGVLGLWAAAILTLITGYDYTVVGLKHMTEERDGAAKS